jgi:hypothetical protein
VGGIYTHKAETKRRAHRQRRRVHGRACHPAEHALTSDKALGTLPHLLVT